MFQQQGQWHRALPIYDRLVSMVDNRTSADAPIDANTPRGETLAMVLYCRARLFVEAGRDEEALGAMRDLLAGLKHNKRSEIVAMVSDVHLMLTQTLMALRRLDDAASALNAARPLVEKLYGAGAPEMTRVLGLEAELLDLRGDKEAAVALHRRAIDGFPADVPLDNPLKVMRVIKYAAALHALGRFAEANAQLKPIVDVYFEKMRDDENPPLFAHYFATRLFDQEDFAGAVAWAVKSLEAPGMNGDNAAFGGMRSILLVFKTTLLAALDELALRDAADAAVLKQAAELRDSIKKELDTLLGARTVSRTLATVSGTVKYLDPATIDDKPVPAAAAAADDDDDDDGEVAGAADDDDGAAAAKSSKEAKAAEPTTLFGKMSITVEIVAHPTLGAKLAAGNHLVATFEHPSRDGDAMLVERTLTSDDIAKSVRDPTLNVLAKSATAVSASTLVFTTAGYFHESKAGAVEVVIDVFEDATCMVKRATHRQLLRCAFDTERIKTYERYQQLPKVNELEQAVDRDYGLSDLHMS